VPAASPSGLVAAVATPAPGAGVSAVPHSLQNLPPETGEPQAWHVAAMALPQSEQNFAPGRLTAPQLAHVSSAMQRLS